MNGLAPLLFAVSLFQLVMCKTGVECELGKYGELLEDTMRTLEYHRGIYNVALNLSKVLGKFYPANNLFGVENALSPNCDPFSVYSGLLKRIDQISEDLTKNVNINKCIRHEQSYFDLKFSELQNYRTSTIFKYELERLCTSRYRGVSRFVSHFLDSLNESNVKWHLRECLKYDSIQLDYFIRSRILRMNQIWILVGVCEEVTGRITEFQKDVFVLDVTHYLCYIQSTMVMHEFRSNKKGLETVVKKIAEISQTPHELVTRLNKNYGYFEWIAIYATGGSFVPPWLNHHRYGSFQFKDAKSNHIVSVEWTFNQKYSHSASSVTTPNNYYSWDFCFYSTIPTHHYRVALKNVHLPQNSRSRLYFDESLVHSYPFDGHLNDTVGGMNVVYTANSTFTLSRNNVQNGAIDLSEGYIKLPTTKFLNSEFTVTMWIKFKVVQRWQPLFRFGSSHLNNSLVVMLSVMPVEEASLLTVFTDVFGYDCFRPLQPIELHKWSHYAFVYSNASLCVYIDGRLLTCSASLKFLIDETDENYIGHKNWWLDTDLNAVVDDFRIYDRALKEFEIRKDSGVAPGLSTEDLSQSALVHYWPFDSSLLDVVSGLNDSGNGSLSFTEDYEGNEESAVDLSRGSIQLPSSLYLNYDFTISAWVKLKEYRNGQVLFSCGGGSTDRIQIRLSEEPHNYFYLYFSPTFNYDVFPSYVPLELNKWRHLTFVVSQSMDSIRMYINGVLVINAFDNKFDFEASGTNNCFIGRSLNMKSNVNAEIDELKIFNRLLKDEEVRENVEIRKRRVELPTTLNKNAIPNESTNHTFSGYETSTVLETIIPKTSTTAKHVTITKSFNKVSNSEWMFKFGRSYYLNKVLMNRSESEEFCRFNGGRLAVIRNEEEMEYLQTFSDVVEYEIHLGATIPRLGDLEWNDGTLNSTSQFEKYWCPGEPNNLWGSSSHINEGCLIGKNKSYYENRSLETYSICFNDENCSAEIMSFCEKEEY